jgi:hypothetical protein
MAIRANSNMTFYIRYLILGLAGLGFGVWAVYDGFIGFPNQIIRANKYREIAEQTKDTDNFAQEWMKYAQDQGWPLEDPGEPKSTLDIWFNYVLAVVCIPVGAYLLFCVIRARNRWIEADDRAIRASWGPEVPLDSITGLNKRAWQKKGIAKVLYEQNGRTKRFVLDDFKFKREPTGQILRKVEARLRDDQITGGPPEPPLQESVHAASAESS